MNKYFGSFILSIIPYLCYMLGKANTTLSIIVTALISLLLFIAGLGGVENG